MKLKAGTQAARDAGYGSLAELRRFQQTPLYKALAERWSKANGVSLSSTRDPRSRFARAMGRAFYKDGKPRPENKRPRSYIERVVPQLEEDTQQAYYSRYMKGA